MPGAVQSPNIVPEMEIISGPNLSEKEDLVSTETKKVAKSSEYRNVLIVGDSMTGFMHKATIEHATGMKVKSA